jgi:outer membrane lipoprotein SlyB
MKKFTATFLMMAFMAMMWIALPSTADAQTRRYVRSRTTTTRTYNRPSFYRRHRNVINMGIGTGAGTILGAIIGGRRGAAVGALAGAGGSALYTYKINPKKRRYYRR